MIRGPSVLLLAALAAVGCKQRPDAQPAARSTDAQTPSVDRDYDYRAAPGCSCGSFNFTWRIRKEDDDPTLEPGRRHFLLVEFLVEKEGRKFSFFPAAECAFPQRIYANKVQLGIACDDRHYVVAGPHWAAAFSIGKMSWTRRIDSDPSLPNYVTRPMTTVGGLEPPAWGSGNGESASADKLSITCSKLPTDGQWVQVVEWGGTPRWYDMLVGTAR